jgi:hypothetical protein
MVKYIHGRDWSTDKIIARLYQLEHVLGSSPVWGAYMTAMDNERKELRAELTRRKQNYSMDVV